ncbi:UNVERIFIED_CONTAM: hypothetical protein K2H54_006275 [Gekko kuhli]
MSGEEGHKAPVTTVELTPVTTAMVLVSTTPLEYLLPNDEEEEDDVEQCLEALERAQRKFHWDLEEVIRAIPDMVVQALQAERDAQLVSKKGAQQQVPGDQINQPRDPLVRPDPDQQAPSPAPQHPAPQHPKDLIEATLNGNPDKLAYSVVRVMKFIERWGPTFPNDSSWVDVITA